VRESSQSNFGINYRRGDRMRGKNEIRESAWRESGSRIRGRGLHLHTSLSDPDCQRSSSQGMEFVESGEEVDESGLIKMTPTE
jgi:hypothetical protein